MAVRLRTLFGDWASPTKGLSRLSHACGRAVLSVGVVAAFLCAGLLCGTVDAGFLVGTATGNDMLENVQAVIDEYNDANDPDRQYPVDELPKTDEPGFSAFADDFMFFSDEDGDNMIGFGDLRDYATAWFEYAGALDLVYYSVKADGGFSLYTYMAGLNVLDFVEFDPPPEHTISHVTFWTGTQIVPELGTGAMCFAAVAAGLLLAGCKRVFSPTT